MDLTEGRQALALVYDRYYAELVRLAFALTGDWPLAEDLAQEAFARTWRRWDRIRRPEAVPAYLRTAVVNLARTSVRRRVRERHAWSVAKPREVATEPASGRTDVLRALSRLPQRKRECVVLRYYLDLSEAETAETLGVSVGTVKSQTAKALRTMRVWLDDSDPQALTPLLPHEGGA